MYAEPKMNSRLE